MFRRLTISAMIAVMACGGGGSPRTSAVTRDRYMIARAELAERASSNLYDAVKALRPSWFNAPLGATGSAAGAMPTVYLDGQKLGTADMLRSLSPDTVERLRYLTVSEAQSKFGSTVSTPVVEVTTRGRG